MAFLDKWSTETADIPYQSNGVFNGKSEDFSIVFEDISIGTVNNALINYFCFSVDIQSPFAYAKVIFNDLKVNSEYYNSIKIGSPATINLGKDGTSTFSNSMRVFSFTKVPVVQGSDAVSVLEVTFISSWYFIDSTKTKAFSDSLGTPLNVGGIVKQALNSDLMVGVEGFTTDIEDTEDIGHMRYQLAQKSQEFIKKVLKYGYIGGLPVFLYTDAMNRIRLRGFKTMLSEEPTCELVPLTTEMPSDDFYTVRPMSSYQVFSDTSNSSYLVKYNLTYNHFKASSNYATSLYTYGAELKNNQISRNTPMREEYLSWCITPSDAKGFAYNENFRRNAHTFGMACKVPNFCLSDFQVGTSVKVAFPLDTDTVDVVEGEDSTKKALGEGVYVIEHIDYTFNQNPGELSTEMSLIQVKY